MTATTRRIGSVVRSEKKYCNLAEKVGEIWSKLDRLHTLSRLVDRRPSMLLLGVLTLLLLDSTIAAARASYTPKR